MTDDEPWMANIIYRGAYGFAYNLEIEHRQGVNWREDGTAWILADTVRMMEQSRGETLSAEIMELAKEAVADVMAHRRPRW